jgi:hypothetical protein
MSMVAFMQEEGEEVLCFTLAPDKGSLSSTVLPVENC